MSIAAALRLMLEKRIRRLPVIEGGEGTERLVGIATLSDVRAGYPAHIDPRSPVAQDAVDSSVTVERIMSRSVLTTTAGVAVEEDAEKQRAPRGALCESEMASPPGSRRQQPQRSSKTTRF